MNENTSENTFSEENLPKIPDTAYAESSGNREMIVEANINNHRTSADESEAVPAGSQIQSQDTEIAPSNEAPQSNLIEYADFAKVELRAARILEAERIPKADKLLKLQVDLGTEKRQILAGIAQQFAPEDLIGKTIVVVANLAPRTMRGLQSQGMLLAASASPDGPPSGLLTIDADVPPGSIIR